MAEIVDRLPPTDAPPVQKNTRRLRREQAESADGEVEDVRPPGPLRLAIVGRPNAGKSTLLNRLLGEERMITGPEPGLTRDSIAVMLSDDEGPIQLVDTAGLRRKARIDETLEKMSVSARSRR